MLKHWNGSGWAVISDDIWQLFVITGQSNAEGWAGTLSSITESNAIEVADNGTPGTPPITDPVGDGDGTAWPSFAKEFYAQTGEKCAISEAAKMGTAVCAVADNGNGNWSPTGSLYDTAVTQTNNAISGMEDAGYRTNFIGWIWLQGEREANAIGDGDLTANDYETCTRNLIARYHSEFGSTKPFFMIRISDNPYVVGDTQPWIDVRAKQDLICSDTDYTYMTFQGTVNYSDTRSHYLISEYEDMGKNVADYIAANFY